MRANKRSRSTQDRCRLLFGLAALSGIVGIVAATVLGAPTGLVASWCVVVVGGYGVIVWWTGGGLIGEQQIGDALNNLGFILALAVLTVTMWMYVAWRSDVAAIVESFAAALASITVGFALKVLVQIFHEDPEDVERSVRVALTEMSREVHVEMLAVIQDLAAFRAALAAEIARTPAKVLALPSGRNQEPAAVPPDQPWADLTSELRLLRQTLAGDRTAHTPPGKESES